MSKKYKNVNERSTISIFSWLIRQFALPNPFKNMCSDAGTAEGINLIFGGIFIPLSFLLTRTWYVSGSDEKWKGSLGFLINYCILTGILLLISKFISNTTLIIGIFAVIYLILCLIECWLLNRNRYVF